MQYLFHLEEHWWLSLFQCHPSLILSLFFFFYINISINFNIQTPRKFVIIISRNCFKISLFLGNIIHKLKKKKTHKQTSASPSGKGGWEWRCLVAVPIASNLEFGIPDTFPESRKGNSSGVTILLTEHEGLWIKCPLSPQHQDLFTKKTRNPNIMKRKEGKTQAPKKKKKIQIGGRGRRI